MKPVRVAARWATPGHAMDARVGRRAAFSLGHILLSENQHISVKVTSWEGGGEDPEVLPRLRDHPSGWGVG